MALSSLYCADVPLSNYSLTVFVRERTIRAHTDTIRYEYSSIHNGRYRYRYEYSVR